MSELIQEACIDVFIPITVGGGIRNIDDIKNALKSGADKVAINTKAVQDPDFIMKKHNIFSGKVSAIEVPKERAVDIDDIYDFMLAEAILKG